MALRSSCPVHEIPVSLWAELKGIFSTVPDRRQVTLYQQIHLRFITASFKYALRILAAVEKLILWSCFVSFDVTTATCCVTSSQKLYRIRRAYISWQTSSFFLLWKFTRPIVYFSSRNEEIREVLGQMDAEHLHEYYKEPVMCLLRIKDSVDTWEKCGGSDGYFGFIESPPPCWD